MSKGVVPRKGKKRLKRDRNRKTWEERERRRKKKTTFSLVADPANMNESIQYSERRGNQGGEGKRAVAAHDIQS